MRMANNTVRINVSTAPVYGSLEPERQAMILACMKVKVRTTRGALLAARRSRALARRSWLGEGLQKTPMAVGTGVCRHRRGDPTR
jgi:hypothetical protein